MSYILDALKKSEQERGHGKVPGVQTMHSSSLNYRSDKKLYWPYILIAAVILNLLAILYFIVDRDRTSGELADKSAQEKLTPDEIPAPVMDNINTQRIENSSVTSERESITEYATTGSAAEDQQTLARSSEKKAATNTAAEETRQPAEPRKTRADSRTTQEKVDVIEFYDLPGSIKNQLPAIIISAHVYSTNPLQRSIVINNKFLEEGEYIIDDLMLHEITADGAIFDFQGTRFHHGVVSTWQ